MATPFHYVPANPFALQDQMFLQRAMLQGLRPAQVAASTYLERLLAREMPTPVEEARREYYEAQKRRTEELQKADEQLRKIKELELQTQEERNELNKQELEVRRMYHTWQLIDGLNNILKTAGITDAGVRARVVHRALTLGGITGVDLEQLEKHIAEAGKQPQLVKVGNNLLAIYGPNRIEVLYEGEQRRDDGGKIRRWVYEQVNKPVPNEYGMLQPPSRGVVLRRLQTLMALGGGIGAAARQLYDALSAEDRARMQQHKKTTDKLEAFKERYGNTRAGKLAYVIAYDMLTGGKLSSKTKSALNRIEPTVRQEALNALADGLPEVYQWLVRQGIE